MKINPPTDISKIFDTFLKLDGQKFNVERNGSIIATYDGLTNTSSTGKDYIGFRPEADIKPNDWLINCAGERFYVKDKKTEIINGKPNELKAYYDSEVDYNNKQTQPTSNIFNITNANNSIIGNNNTVSLSYSESLDNLKNEVQNSTTPDKQELKEIVALLELILNNKVPASKGIFSKFSAVMERNSWITGSIMSTIFAWLSSHI